VRAAEAWRGYKPTSFALLDLESGDSVLDVGCGTGEDARDLARLVPGVSVLGIDARAETVAEAERLTLGLPRAVDFRVGDAHRLDVEAASVDAVRADKVFHHLEDPAKALAEMARVARPGGRVVVSDADYETLVVDLPDRALTRRILDAFCDRLPHGWIGRRLPALFGEAGLSDVRITPYTAVVTDYDESVLGLREKVEDAASAGLVTSDEVTGWVAALDAADHAGRFLCALTIFTVSGRKR
jgi:ubiquinone/menaquinone biosynthesis C-methylase UbiE